MEIAQKEYVKYWLWENKMPKVSVIVPIYGVEQYLRQAIDSVLAQTLKDIEIILINDGSKDSCPQIINEYAQKDNRIVAIHKENGGYGAACNLGLSKATGDYIAIFEPDDFIDATMYEDLYNIAKKYDSDVVKSAYWEINDLNPNNVIKKYCYWGTDITSSEKSFKVEDFPNFLYHHPSIWSCIYRRAFLEKHSIRFVEAKAGGWVDNPFQVATFCLAERINWTPLAYYNYRPESIGNSSNLKDYKIPLDRFNDIHDFFDTHSELYVGKVFEYVTKKEISYLYNAFKIAFKYAKTFSEIPVIEKDFKDILKRIPKLRKTEIIDKFTLKMLDKMNKTNYKFKYLMKKDR